MVNLWDYNAQSWNILMSSVEKWILLNINLLHWFLNDLVSDHTNLTKWLDSSGRFVLANYFETAY